MGGRLVELAMRGRAGPRPGTSADGGLGREGAERPVRWKNGHTARSGALNTSLSGLDRCTTAGRICACAPQRLSPRSRGKSRRWVGGRAHVRLQKHTLVGHAPANQWQPASWGSPCCARTAACSSCTAIEAARTCVLSASRGVSCFSLAFSTAVAGARRCRHQDRKRTLSVTGDRKWGWLAGADTQYTLTHSVRHSGDLELPLSLPLLLHSHAFLFVCRSVGLSVSRSLSPSLFLCACVCVCARARARVCARVRD